MRGFVGHASARLVLSAAGALLGAAVVALLEARIVARAASGELAHGFGALFLGDLGVVGPLALVVGVAVGVLALVLEPERPRSPAEHAARLREGTADARARRAAAGPLVALVVLVWCVVMAHAGRRALSHGAPLAAGFELAGFALGTALVLVVCALAIVAPLGRALEASRVRRLIDPVTTGAAGIALALALLLSGIALGDSGGEGPTPLAIFGVLKRRELDLRPVMNLAILVGFAHVVPLLFARTRGSVALIVSASLSLVIIGSSIGLTRYEAYALNTHEHVARALERSAPLGKTALALLRAATDRDHDGASPLFAGGDCNDHDPNVGPDAIDIPGNGIDEDCSGADTPAPPPPLPEVPVFEPAPELAKSLIDRDMNLVLITIDTLRIDVGFMGYKLPVTPNLDKLAAKSTVFDRAYALASYTGKSLGPMLIGRYPSETLRDGAHFTTYAEGNVFLAERLKDAGVFTMGCASFWYFQKKYGMAQGIDAWDMSAMPYSYSAETDTSVTSAELTDVAIKQLAEHGPTRFFQWVHYFDPHAQYMQHAGAPSFFQNGDKYGKFLYDGELWFTDKHVGRLLDFIASQPWGKDTIIVVTGDHGEAFGEHDLNWHGTDLWEPLVRTPLVVYVPGAEPHHVAVKRSHIDIVPTLLEAMRLPKPAPGELAGVSLMPDVTAKDEPVERDVYMDMPPGPVVLMRHAILTGKTPGMKLIHRGGSYYALYDLAKDPDEMSDVSYDKAKMKPVMEAFDRLRSRLKEIWVAPDAPDK